MTWARLRPLYKNIFVAIVTVLVSATFFVTPVSADAASDYCGGKYTTGNEKGACITGYRDASASCSSLLEGLGQAGVDACKDGVEAGKAANGAGSGTGSSDTSEQADDEVVCSAGALGWVLCPAMKVMADAVSAVADILGNYLAFNPFAGEKNAIKQIWSNLLNVANIMLVVAFLAVVFSQSTSIGLSNYGIKRMLPRIFAAAILMNLSYYICQILVDISNIAGVGVTSLVSATTGTTFAESVANVNPVGYAVAVTGIVAILLFFFLVPTVLAFLAVLFTIAARNAIIVLLVIVSPLAFAAWILPNTEKYFKKWWELLVSMLMLYPLVMLLFAASIVAANAINTVTPADATATNSLNAIISLIVLSLPLFALPFLFKSANGALNTIQNMSRQRLQKTADGKMGQAARNKAKSYGKFGAFAAGAGISRAGNRATGGKMFNPNKPGRITRAYRGSRAMDKAIETSLAARQQGVEARSQEMAAKMGTNDDSRTARALGSVGGPRYQEIAAAQVEKAFSERKKAIVTSFDQRPTNNQTMAQELQNYEGEFNEAINKNDDARAGAIIDFMTSARGAGGRDALEGMLTRTAASGNVKLGSDVHRAINNAINKDNYSTLVSKRGAIAKGGFEFNADGSSTSYRLNLGGVGTEQLATQDAASLRANFDQIKPEEAHLVMTNGELRSKISDAAARALIERKASEYVPQNPTPSSGNGTN